MYKPLLLILLCFFCVSCGDENLVVEQNFDIPGDVWAASDKAVMEFDITDTVNQNNFYLNVRNTEAYPYSNLYVFVKTKFPNGKSSLDTVGCVLADPSGAWTGSGSGFLFSNQIHTNKVMYKYNRRFPIAGRYTVEIEQAMRMDSLQGIKNIGLRIERTQNALK